MLPKKDHFLLPDGVIYLDGNSLGPLPKGAAARALETIGNEWGNELIRAWNTAGWMALPRNVGDRVALAEGLIGTIEGQHELRTPSPEDVLDHINEDVAVVMLTQVDYRTGRMHDMAKITKAAQDAGAIMLWDLAHSAGAVPVDIAASQAEFAVGCTYKYLNGGPGAPAFIYIRPDLVEHTQPALSGWLGHDAPFDFDLSYRPAMSTERMRVGTPPILQLATLDAALNVWDDVDMQALRAASVALSEQFIEEASVACPQLSLISPRDSAQRGSQVSFAFEHGYAAMQALIDHGVIGDFRAPNVMRFGFTPNTKPSHALLERKTMTVLFVQIRCRPGTSYKVADEIGMREIHSELYSVSGDFDLLLKLNVPDGSCSNIAILPGSSFILAILK